ncbi:peptidylprolyl isomerase [Amaricoccus sp.]|uniref:peptidylprolyl isomerase n=1 Tax=Amaricoccus sp. TaxID=1872485 RepID=UPI001B41566E|nr:peptidylprolyl isomerase [Amaricoccus sp.]MBP7003107.1 peptidylprolyl isomerase [Amaricoccus sp.]
MRRQLTAGLLAGLALAGAAFAQDQAATAADAPAAAPAGDWTAETVLATVNGRNITLGNVIAALSSLPQQYQGLPDEALMTGLLDQLIDQTLLADTVSTDPAEDPLSVRLAVENERRGSLASLAVQERIGKPVDEAAVKAAYDARVAEFQPAKEWSAAHILVATEDEAKAIKAELDGGADFAAIAKEKSTDPGSGPNGGSLGWFGAGQMVPEFEAAVAALQPGQTSDPVQSQFGWHIVRLDEVRDSAPPPLDQLRPEIENELRQKQLEAELASLRAAAKIEKPETGVAPAAIRQVDLLTN